MDAACAAQKDKNMIIVNQKEIKGMMLYVYPIYGWGWTDFNDTIEPPDNFYIKVAKTKKSLFTVNGISGQIESENHGYNSYYIEADLRYPGRYNFTNRIGNYNIWISDQPINKIESQKNTNQKYIYGYGFIGEEQFVIDFANNLFHKK